MSEGDTVHSRGGAVKYVFIGIFSIIYKLFLQMIGLMEHLPQTVADYLIDLYIDILIICYV